jgi:diaminopimelate epimerase
MDCLRFTKASACGNDFLIMEGGRVPAGKLAELTRRICNRHEGVGGDGVEWLFPDGEADVRAHLLNADGSEAEISGNGTRCVAAHLVAQNGREKVFIRTGAGVKTCTLLRRDGTDYEFETNMGEPQVGEEFSIRLAFHDVGGIPVSMGNPHFVLFVKEFAAGWQAEAAEIERHHDFKYGVNVELVRVMDSGNIDIRIFERGVGETQSSGTGSCAAAVAAIHSGKANSLLKVHTPGGSQVVRWEGDVFLQGPARLICQGEFFV